MEGFVSWAANADDEKKRLHRNAHNKKEKKKRKPLRKKESHSKPHSKHTNTENTITTKKAKQITTTVANKQTDLEKENKTSCLKRERVSRM